MKIQVIKDKELKKEVCAEILKDLPEWFGIEGSLLDYIQGVGNKEFYAALLQEKYIGFFSVKIINEFTAEFYVNGVLKEFHRKGIGREIAKTIEADLKGRGFKLLMVKTISESLDNIPYSKTRNFYRSIGFFPLEEIKEIWGMDSPCLIMVKSLL